jgi:hypothetical protein
MGGVLVSALVSPRYRKPPPLYRLARALRRIGVLLLVLVILFVATALYSAYETARSGASSSNFGYAFGANNTVVLSGNFSFSNGGIYPIDGFTVHLRVENTSGTFLGESSVGPVNFAPGGRSTFPVVFVLPIAVGTAAASLLTTDQYLNETLYANATFAYVFPVSVELAKNSSWGAPFADLSLSVGTPTTMGGTTVVPVTVQFENDASFEDAGSLEAKLVSESGTVCGSGTYSIEVPPQTPYSQTNDVTLTTGCSIAGGTVVAIYTTSGGQTVALPPEAIP